VDIGEPPERDDCPAADRVQPHEQLSTSIEESGFAMKLSFTLSDQADRPWVLADHLDAGVAVITLRGDW
jgi:hypothetical protein